MQQRQWWRPFHRAGAKPLFLAADLLAFAASAAALSPYWPFVLVLGMIAIPLFGAAGLYRSRLTLSVLDDLPVIAGRFAVALVLTGIAGILLGVNGTAAKWWPQDRPVVTLVYSLALILVLLVLSRSGVYAVVRRLRMYPSIAHRTVIVGTDPVARDVVRALRDRPTYGLLPIGYLESADPSEELGDLPVLGEPQDLEEILERYGARVAVVSFGLGAETTLLDVIRMTHRHRCEVFVVPRLHELHPVAADVEDVWGTPLIRLRRAAYRTPTWRLKRAVDVVLSAVAMTLLSPVLATCALLVRLDGGPGVIFRQQRVGVDGRHFDVLKFRSLRPVDEEESSTQWNIARDARLSGIGRFLRRTSLDELPQLWNILRGDMSLVGPRPERPHFVKEFAELYPSYLARHRVPCGLTGLAQVNGLRGDTSIADRAKFDNLYIENWSMWLDMKIVLRTFSSVLGARGA